LAHCAEGREGRFDEKVSETDRNRWNDRYESGEYQGRTHPSELIRNWHRICNVGSALDLACGIGRNSVYLADQGFNVTGLDIADVAIDKAIQVHCNPSRNLRFQVMDLENASIQDKYDLIVMFRYVNLDLLERLVHNLNQDGVIMIEEHLVMPNPKDFAGPKSLDFRVESGTLRKHLGALRVLHEFEGPTHDPDGQRVALSQLVARKI